MRRVRSKEEGQIERDKRGLIFAIMDVIRERGQDNMFGAGPILADAWRDIGDGSTMNRREQKKWVLDYMSSPEEERPNHKVADFKKGRRIRVKQAQQTPQ